MREARVASAERAYAVCLLDEFSITRSGEPVQLSPGEQRVVACLALKGRPLDRPHLAETLWGGSSPQRAAGNLRSTVYRIHRDVPGLMDTEGGRLSLDRRASVDLHRLDERLDGLLRPDAPSGEILLELETRRLELLPGWYDDWLVFERERLRQRYLHALELASALRLGQGNAAESIDVALTAVTLDPMRESPRRLLIRAHLSEGNVSEAARVYAEFEDLLRDELGISPTQELTSLVPPALRRRSRGPGPRVPRPRAPGTRRNPGR